MLRLIDLFPQNHIPGSKFDSSHYEQAVESTLSRESTTLGPNGAVHTQAREGPGTSSYTIVPSHALKACQHLRSSSSSSLCRRPPAAALALLGNGVHTHIVIGQMAVCLTRVCPTQTRGRASLGQARHGVWPANEMAVINVSSSALCKAHTLHNHSERQQHGLCRNFLSRAHAS